MISLDKLKILKPLQKLPENVGDLGKKWLPKALKRCPKSNKFPNLVTLVVKQDSNIFVQFLTFQKRCTSDFGAMAFSQLTFNRSKVKARLHNR